MIKMRIEEREEFDFFLKELGNIGFKITSDDRQYEILYRKILLSRKGERVTLEIDRNSARIHIVSNKYSGFLENIPNIEIEECDDLRTFKKNIERIILFLGA